MRHLQAKTLKKFQASLRGPLIQPGDANYDTVCGVVCCYAGPLQEAEKVVQPLYQCAPPLFEHLGPMPYPMLQIAFDALYPPGLQWYWKGDFVNALSDEAIALHVQYGTQLPTQHSTMHLYPINGAPHRVGTHDTAFSYREATWSEVIVGVDPDPANLALSPAAGEGQTAGRTLGSGRLSATV